MRAAWNLTRETQGAPGIAWHAGHLAASMTTLWRQRVMLPWPLLRTPTPVLALPVRRQRSSTLWLVARRHLTCAVLHPEHHVAEPASTHPAIGVHLDCFARVHFEPLSKMGLRPGHD